MDKFRILSGTAMALSLLVTSNAAHAQSKESTNQEGGLDVIVVTAQKRAEGLQDVPISIVAVSGESMTAASTDSLQDLSGSVPNLLITQSGITSEIGVRGVYSGGNKGFEQSVGMFVDGIYYGRDQFIRLPLLDLERVEVLRGPQPTLFGKNAIAGAVSVTTAKPTDEFEAKFSALYEPEHEEKQFTGIVSGPLGENGFKARLTASYREMDGFIRNTTLDRDEASLEETYVRAQLAYEGDAPIQFLLKAEYANFDSVGRNIENYGPVGNYSTIFAGPLFVDTTLDYQRQGNGSNSLNDAFISAMNVNFDLGGDYTLTSTTGFTTYKTTELIDVDYTGLSLLDGTNQSEDFDQFSQELRITSPAGETVEFIGGLYYQSQKLTVTDSVQFNPFFLATPFAAIGDTTNERFYKQSADTYSVFAQATWNATDRLKLTAGARYNHEKKDGSRNLSFTAGPLNTGFTTPSPVPGFASLSHLTFAALNIEEHSISGSRKENSFNPIANIQYEATDNINLFASFSRGTKAGGFDIRGNSLPTSTTVAIPATFQFAEETATNFEGGLKARWNNADFNIAYFNSRYKDLQQSVFDGTLNFNVQNAARASIQGVEVDGRYLLTDGLVLSGSLAFLDFEFDSFPTAQCFFGQTPGANGFCDIQGQRPARTPKWTGNLAIDYEREISDNLEFGINLNMDYSSSYLTASNLDPNTQQGSYATFDGRISIGQIDKGWRLSVIANNIFDKRVLLVSSGLPLATTFTGGAGIAYYGLFNRPRNIAFKADFSF